MMERYWYRACDATGEIVEGESEADSEFEIAAGLQRRGATPIKITLAKGKQAPGGLLFERRSKERMTGLEVADFVEQLGHLIQSGIELDPALKIIASSAESPPLRRAALKLSTDLRQGTSLSAAISSGSYGFPTVFVPIIRAGEASGALGPCLRQIADQQNRLQELKDRVVSALMYPMVLVVVAVISVMVIVTVVLPKLRVLFEGMGAALPFLAEVILRVGDWCRDWFLLLFAAVLTGSFALMSKMYEPEWRRRIDAALLSLPLVGRLIRDIALGRFFRLLGMLLDNGVTLSDGMTLAIQGIGNRALTEKMARVPEQVKNGETLSKALASTGIFRGQPIQMLRVAERSGALAEMSLDVARLYDRRTEKSLQRIVTLIEPTLILGIAIVVGTIVFILLSAVLSINELPF